MNKMAGSGTKRQRLSEPEDETTKRQMTSVSQIDSHYDADESSQSSRHHDSNTHSVNGIEEIEDRSLQDDSEDGLEDELTENLEDGPDVDLTEDSDREQEFEVEEQTHPIPCTPPRTVASTVTIKSFITRDEEFKDWMESIHVICTYEGKVIGRTHGRYIERDLIRSHFYCNMEEPCQDTSDLAYKVFDRYGYLKDELKEHCVRKGSGAWGSELDDGTLLLIESIQVERDWRRMGLGTLMSKKMVAKAQAYKFGTKFALTITGWLNWDLQDQIDGKSVSECRAIRWGTASIADKFFRSMGFRRIGVSSCFGLSSDDGHAAYKISPDDDYDPPEDDISQDDDKGECEDDEEDDYDCTKDPFGDALRERKILKRMLKRRPLHHAVTTMEDSTCVAFLTAHIMLNNKTQPEWKQLDAKRKNILHIAACLQKPKTVQWLLQNVDEANILSHGRSNEGYTPLEALQSELESIRTTLEHGMMKICMSDSFAGFPSSAVNCLGSLRGLQNLTVAQVRRLSYGCTCGDCVEGFLSPRMKYMLHSLAEETYEMLTDDILTNGIGDGCWCETNHGIIQYVPSSTLVYLNTNKSLRQGFSNLFEHIAATLRANMIPNNQNVLDTYEDSSEWPPVTRNFLQRGGTVESALMPLFERGRDEHVKAGYALLIEIDDEEYKKLKKCRNDHEYGFVAKACGLQSKFLKPY